MTLPLGHGPQPLRRRRPRSLHRRPVRQGDAEPGRLPGGVEDRHGRDRNAAAAGRLADRHVFLGKQLSRDPASGNEYRIFVDAESARFGVSVRLVGNVSADPKTGQLDDDLRRQPAGPVHLLQARSSTTAPRRSLTSPPTCGPNTSSSAIDPYSGTPAATPTAASR